MGLTVLIVSLAWYPAIDRQDIIKLAALAGATAVAAGAALRGRDSLNRPIGIALMVIMGLGVSLPGWRTGFEAWTSIWLVAVGWWLAPRIDRRRLAGWIALAASFQALLAVLGEVWDPWGHGQWVSFQGRRALGTFGNPTLLGIWLAAVFPLCFAVRWRWAAAALVAAGVVACRSRVGLVLLSVAAVALLIGRRPRRIRWVGLLIPLAVSVVSLAGGFEHVFDPAPWRERLAIARAALSGLMTEGPSTWMLGLGPEAFANHWLLWRGRDEGVAELALRHAHIDIVEWAVEFGIGGVVLFVGLVYWMWLGFRSPEWTATLAGITVALLLAASFVQPTLVTVPGIVLCGAALSMVVPAPPGNGQGAALAVAAAVAIVCGLVGIRGSSERLRAQATLLRVGDHDSLATALAAARVDAGNDRAWLEVAMARDGEPAITRMALQRVRIRGLSNAE